MPKFPLMYFSISIILLFTSSAAAQDVNKLVILTEEYPPYNFMDDGRVSGISTEIVLDILDHLGSTLTRDDIQLVPWARAYNEVLQSKNTIIYSILRNSERENSFKWVGPIACATVGVIARKKDNVNINTPTDFEKYHIGVVREDIGHQMMRKILPERDLDIANSSTVNLRKLREGRIDMFVYDTNVVDFVLKQLHLDPRDYEEVYLLDKAQYYIAFNKNADDALINSFQSALDQILKKRPAIICE